MGIQNKIESKMKFFLFSELLLPKNAMMLFFQLGHVLNEVKSALENSMLLLKNSLHALNVMPTSMLPHSIKLKPETSLIVSPTSSTQCMNAPRSKLNIHSVSKITQATIQSCALSRSINVALKNLLASVNASANKKLF